VYIYRRNPDYRNIAVLRGNQLGGYFGAAIATCDINNDGFDDLVVGAPLHSVDQNEGQVYVSLSTVRNY
jgi:hypothetical protein